MFGLLFTEICKCSPKISTKLPITNLIGLVNAGNSLIGGIFVKNIGVSGNLTCNKLTRFSMAFVHFLGEFRVKASFPPIPITIRSVVFSSILGIIFSQTCCTV